MNHYGLQQGDSSISPNTLCGDLETYWSPLSYTHKHTECIFKTEIELNLCISFHLEVYIFRENVLKASIVLLFFTSIDRRPSIILEKDIAALRCCRGMLFPQPFVLWSFLLEIQSQVLHSLNAKLYAISQINSHVIFVLTYSLLYQFFSLKLNEASGVSLLLKPLKFLLNIAYYHKLSWMPE